MHIKRVSDFKIICDLREKMELPTAMTFPDFLHTEPSGYIFGIYNRKSRVLHRHVYKEKSVEIKIGLGKR